MPSTRPCSASGPRAISDRPLDVSCLQFNASLPVGRYLIRTTQHAKAPEPVTPDGWETLSHCAFQQLGYREVRQNGEHSS